METLERIAECFDSPFAEVSDFGGDFKIGSLSINEAYQVQSLVVNSKLARGERTIGYKVGCTSDAIRKQFGLTEPIYGRLLQPHIYSSGSSLEWSRYCQLAVEPEFVIRIREDIPTEVGSVDELGPLIDSVAAGIELHHYRFRFSPPTIQELVASNGIHAGLVMGEFRTLPESFNWDTARMALSKDDHEVASGVGAAIMGGPLISLQWLANRLVATGQCLRAGDLVIPGSHVELVPVECGERVRVSIEGIGGVTSTFI